MSKNLKNYGIDATSINWQWTSKQLGEYAVNHEDAVKTDTGAINILTGRFTGRSPQDRFIVKDKLTEDIVWWDGKINIPFDENKFDALYNKVAAHLSEKTLFISDALACSDQRYQLKIRAVTEKAWASLFVKNMFIDPTEDDLANFGEPDWLILNAPSFEADPIVDGTRQANFSILNFTRKIALIGGSGYTGEMKKGIFSALNLILPTFHETLPMHCSANIGANGDTAMFFGLSGTGKTTLSADKNRQLIGDDEHGWTADNTVFNFEGGCYAKVIDLTEEKEPEIFGAIKEGTLLENCRFFPDSNKVNYLDDTITENIRASYPIEFIVNIAVPSIGHNPKNIFFLCFDAFGVFPPIAKLNPDQAAYLFISGYTSKVAGTEVGITEPTATFSTCFGAPFMPLHPTVYANMLSEKVEQTGVNVWLVNTGWNGKQKRMSLKDTRNVINAALNGDLNQSAFNKNEFFGFEVPTNCPNVEAHILDAANSWDDKSKYEETAKLLAEKFRTNFKKFESNATTELLAGGPLV